MQEINWNNFKAKFNGKEQKTFEQLCYLLFCDEFNMNGGIFRYKNQTGIETEPIVHDGKTIGFQAKFYETKVSDNKKDIQDSIDKAKNKNAKLDEILFYLHQEFSESSKKNEKEPVYKIEIENYAKAKGVEIEWRVPSHFEIQLNKEKNIESAKHFFSLDKSLIDFIEGLQQHTDSILAAIDSKIIFKDKEIKINRSQTINNLKDGLAANSLTILSGEAGVGKTAVIKDFYDSVKAVSPFFIFKATEFNISNINQLFAHYGNFTFVNFLKEYKDLGAKYIVIDSAEKLSDIEYKEVFQEFLATLNKNGWKVIFTTRYSYLDDLRFQLVEVYQVICHPINIDNLTAGELATLSKKHSFNLPNNERMLELLRNPFYLNEYLQNYDGLGNAISFSDFKTLLWSKQIAKTSYKTDNAHIRREGCFLKIAHKRATEGFLFVKADDCDNEILRSLEADEIIKYDSNIGGYFITHDIYEEWALDKIIERSFSNSKEYGQFFKEIGSSLPIRRAFRNWLSEKLLSDKDKVAPLIENAINDNQIEACWTDEIYVSILLSDHAEVFFKIFENKLLADNQKLLVRIVFLLRIGCKEIDEDLLKLLGIQKTAGLAIKTLFTKPKGKGWDCTIDFICKHKKELGLQKISVILSLLDDWNNKQKKGETTKKASQIALYYYEEITKDKYSRYSLHGANKDQLMRVILCGASEITEELKTIFDEIISKKLTTYRDKYYDIIKTILTSMTDAYEVVKTLPIYVIKLADIFWFQNPDEQTEEDYRYSRRMDMDDYFGISGRHNDYFPASAFQTPIYQLLRQSPQETVDFILSFTNKTTECYVKSGLDGKIEEVDVFTDEAKPIKQYVSNRLWCMYRGTQVAPHVLESMHMALEKWLLEIAKTTPKNVIEGWCLYIIKNSKSTSITALVESAVLSQSSKLFGIAKILFMTKEFFLYDTARMMLDEHAKLQYSIGYGFNYENKIYQDERIKTCEDSHRKRSLEHLALAYQLFKTEDESEDEVRERQKIIWSILDKYYSELPDKTSETDSDKTWRLYLARMDRRKMSPKVEESDEGVLIKFNPDMDPELRKHSETALQAISEKMKYTGLRVWAHYRFTKEETGYKKYPQYENNPTLVIKETKDIIEGLKSSTEEYSLFNRSVPAYSCSVLMRDFFDKLNTDEKEFCRGIIIAYAALPLITERYMYQISDGTEAAISLLPKLIEYSPKNKKEIKILLLRLLLSPFRETSLFAVSAILYDLWDINFDDANAMFLGFLMLSPKFDALAKETRDQNYQNNSYEDLWAQVSKAFLKKYKKELVRIVSNKVVYDELENIENLNLETLTTAFELLPIKTDNEDHEKFLSMIFPVFSKKIFQDEDRIDYTLRHGFLNKLAYFVLNLPKDKIKAYLQPFVENFDSSREMAEFFQEFVSAEDKLDRHDEFWIVWDAFYEKLIDICKNKNNHYTAEVVCSYLLASAWWNKNAKDWHTLKDNGRSFYKKVSENMGYHPAVLYSISKVLNDIGSNFITDGLYWISHILQNNKELTSDELGTNTIFYIETFIRRYILKERQQIRKSASTRNQVIIVLNFLVEKGSIVGYLLRDDIL